LASLALLARGCIGKNGIDGELVVAADRVLGQRLRWASVARRSPPGPRLSPAGDLLST
jgi:hypothetical protein